MAGLAPAAHAQRGARVRPAFEPKLVRRQTVSGIVRFRIVARADGLPQEFAPIGTAGWAAVVRVDGHIIASCTALPAVVTWDTRLAGDGDHEVHVAVRNSRADQEVGVEGASVIVDNAAADTASEASALARQTVSEGGGALLPRLQVPDTATKTALRARFTQSKDLLSARATALLPTGSRLYLGLPDGGIAFCAANSPSPGKAVVGSVIRLPVGDGAVQSLAVANGNVWWTTEGGRTVYVYSAAAHHVTRYDVTALLVSPPLPEPPEPAPEVIAAAPPAVASVSADTEPGQTPPFVTPVPSESVAPPTPPKPTGWVRSIALLRGRVLLLGDAGTARVLDPSSGTLTPVSDDILPKEAVSPPGERPAARLSIASSGDGSRALTIVVSVTPSPVPAPVSEPAPAKTETENGVAVPVLASNGGATTATTPRWRRYTLRAWRGSGDGAWKPIADFATDADPDLPARLAVAPDAVATAEREGLRVVAAKDTRATPRDLPYALSPGMPSSTDRVVVGVSGLWWEQRGIIFRANPRTGARDAYLPWNVSDGTGAVTALAPDPGGVWVATMSGGVRHIVLGRPSARDGYNGYIKAPLGADTLHPPTPRCNNMACAIDAWQGTRYVWGGQSRSGTDCSGFVMRMHGVCGVSVPRTSSEMRHTSQGRRVLDELHWGDTLVYPGHCGIYIGDGRTAETVGGTRGGSVSHGSVWVRSSVVVKRFLR